MYHQQSWKGKGLNVGLTLIMLFLVLAPVGEARELEEASQYALMQLPASPAGTSGDAGELAAASLSDLGAIWRLPFLRSDHSAIYDAPNDRIIVFGGWNGRQFFNDVWALDTTEGSEAWTKLNPHSAWPPPRAQHTAIYDAANQRMIVFGGHQSHYNFNDVWALDLSTPGTETWSNLLPTGLPIGDRRYHSAVYDATNQRMVVFGGSGRGGLRNDVWTLDLTPGVEAWSQLAVTGSVPPARWQHTAIYDSQNGLMVVFGGTDGSTLRNDAWALNLTTQHWAALSPAGDPPPARRKHSAVFHHPIATPYGTMIVFGGWGNDGFLDDAWYLKLTPGEIEWFQTVPTSPSSPAARAGHAAAHINEESDYRMVVLGGRGMDSLAGETQWVYDVPTVSWSPLTPTLPDWWQGGVAAQSVHIMQSNGRPDVTLQIEDAQPDTTVNVLPNQEVWFVTQIKTTSAAYANDVDVTLDVVASKFDIVQVGTRYKDAHDVTNWTTPTNLGGGRCRLEDVDLEKRGSDSKYQLQIVFKATAKADADPGRTFINVVAEGTSWLNALDYNAYAAIRQDPRAWIITNRTQLFDEYDNGEVRRLLDKTFEIAQGGAENNNSPAAVVLYADRYVPALTTWDNTTVNYTSEATANAVADEVADWLVNWVVEWGPPMTYAYPNYLVILGDDNIIPRYRKDDYDDIISEDTFTDTWGLEPVLDELVSHDYFWTDNPYGDREYGTVHQDWDEGGLEVSVGRIVGGSAQDLRNALRYANRGPNPNEDRAIIASDDGDCFDWDVTGSAQDARHVLGVDLGYNYDGTFVDGGPTKPQIVSAMQDGFAVAALAHHGTVTAWTTPGDGDHLWSYEVPVYDSQDRMSDNRPFFYFNACRVGLTYGSGWDDPAVAEDGPEAYDDSLVYGLVHQGLSGVVASGGLMYYFPGNDSLCCGETLSNDFWVQAQARPQRSDPLGWALRQAKRTFSIGGNYDRKTVQEFTYFGLPWTRLPGHGATQAAAPAMSRIDATLDFWSTSTRQGAAITAEATYVVTASVDAATYALSTTTEGFDLIAVQDLSQRIASGQPVLPQATLELVLPLSATVTSLVFTPTQSVVLPNLDIPSVILGVGTPDGPTGSYTHTVDGVYPVTATFESSALDTYQLVQIHVIPVTYDATNDQATLYRTVDIAVTYDTPETIGLTSFEPDEIQYLPGETISTTTQVINAGDTTETVTATLMIQDTEGQLVGFQESGPFDVPAGGAYDLELGWTGSLDGDVYLARMFIWKAGQVVAGDGAGVSVTAGEVSELTVPDLLMPGAEGTFEVTFDNLGANTSVALASLAIYDTDDALVAFLPSQVAAVAGGGSTTLSFQWTPDEPGAYAASFLLAAGGQEYGPLSQSFKVGYQVYLPLVLRNY